LGRYGRGEEPEDIFQYLTLVILLFDWLEAGVYFEGVCRGWNSQWKSVDVALEVVIALAV